MLVTLRKLFTGQAVLRKIFYLILHQSKLTHMIASKMVIATEKEVFPKCS